MLFKDFENIDIDASLGVSPVGEDTKNISKYAVGLNPTRALDVGTGTGFIPIYLSTLGIYCDGTDINPLAIECAKKNAKNNNVRTKFFLSDLFASVSGTYGLIIFNPPYGSSTSGTLTRLLEVVKSLLPKENPVVAAIAFELIKRGRRRMIEKFLQNSGGFLYPNGSIILVLHKTELPLLGGLSYKIFGEFKYLRFVHVTI